MRPLSKIKQLLLHELEHYTVIYPNVQFALDWAILDQMYDMHSQLSCDRLKASDPYTLRETHLVR